MTYFFCVVFGCISCAGRIQGESNWILSKSLSVAEGRIFQVTSSPDGQWVAISSKTDIPSIWDVRSGKLVVEAKFKVRNLQTCFFSPNAKQVASGCGTDSKTFVWNTDTGELMYSMRGSAGRFSDDGRLLFLEHVQNGPSICSIYDASSGEEFKVYGDLAAFRKEKASGKRVGQYARILCEGYADETLIDAKTEQTVKVFGPLTFDFEKAGARSFDQRYSVKLHLIDDSRNPEIVDASGKVVELGPMINVTKFSPAELTLAATATNMPSKCVELWSIKTQKKFKELCTKVGSISDFAWVMNGEGLVVVTDQGQLMIWTKQ